MWMALNQRLKKSLQERGQVAEWLKAADCKSARVCVRWFESSPVHQYMQKYAKHRALLLRTLLYATQLIIAFGTRSDVVAHQADE